MTALWYSLCQVTHPGRIIKFKAFQFHLPLEYNQAFMIYVKLVAFKLHEKNWIVLLMY